MKESAALQRTEGETKEEKYIFLKTIIPSRKATRDYKKEIEEKNEIR
jgi:hypothetical protein